MCSNNYDINTICRICLKTEKNLIDIFSSTSEILSINIAIMECAPISISEEDSLPRKICTSCLDTLKIAYNFKILCIESDRILHNDTSDTASINDGDSEKLEIIPEIIGLQTTFNEPTEKYEEEEYEYEYFLLDDSSMLLENENENVVPVEKDDTSNFTQIFEETNVKNRSKPVKVSPLKRRKRKRMPLTIKSHADGYFYCEICNKKYKRKDSLKEHYIIHTDFRYRCNECGKQFDHRLRLRRHRYKHQSETKFYCEMCGYICCTLESLKSHQRVHITRREYKCGVCGKEFKLKRYLRNHSRIHQDERPYICETCGKSFKRSDHLAVHSRQHQIKKRFQCVKCPQSFIAKRSLQQHLVKNCSSS